MKSAVPRRLVRQKPTLEETMKKTILAALLIMVAAVSFAQGKYS